MKNELHKRKNGYSLKKVGEEYIEGLFANINKFKMKKIFKNENFFICLQNSRTVRHTCYTLF